MGKTLAEFFEEYSKTCKEIYENEKDLKDRQKNNENTFWAFAERINNNFRANEFVADLDKLNQMDKGGSDYYEQTLQTVRKHQEFLVFFSLYHNEYGVLGFRDNPEMPKVDAGLADLFDKPELVNKVNAFQMEFHHIAQSVALGKKNNAILFKAQKIQEKDSNIYYKGDYGYYTQDENSPDYKKVKAERISYRDAILELEKGQPITVYNGFSRKGTKYTPTIENGKLTRITPERVERKTGEVAPDASKDSIFYTIRSLVDAQNDLSASDHWYSINTWGFIKCKTAFSDAIDALKDYYKAPDPNKIVKMRDKMRNALASVTQPLIDAQSGKNVGLFVSKQERIQALQSASIALEQSLQLCNPLTKETGKQMKERFNSISKETGDPKRDKANFMSMVKMCKYSSVYGSNRAWSQEYVGDILDTRTALTNTISSRISEAGAKDINDLGKKLGLNKKELQEVASTFGKNGMDKVEELIDNPDGPVMQ